MGLGLRSLAAALVLTLLPACGGKKAVTSRFVIAHAATSDARCVPTMGNPPDDLTVQGTHLASLRLSLRAHAAGDLKGQFGCDLVVQVPRDNPNVRLPLMNATSVDVYAEAFAALQPGQTYPNRVAVGSLLDVPATAKTLPDLRMYPADAFRCVKTGMVRPRAFHTATLLPNNQVLILGGLVSSATVPGAEAIGLGPLFVTGDAELYDPSTGSFTKVTEKSGTPVARAFHHAALVDESGGKYTLLVVGGVSAPDATMPVLGLNTGGAPGTRLVPFDTSSSILNPLTTRAAATAELVVYDPATTSVSRTMLPGFTPAAYQAGAPFADGIAVAGGTDWGDPLETEMHVSQIAVRRGSETPRGTMALATPRMGATMTALDDDTALVWGGAIDPTAAVGELLTGLKLAGTITTTPLALPGALDTLFHTATLLDAAPMSTTRTVLVTGGFLETTTAGDLALDAPPPDLNNPSARLVAITPSTGSVTVSGVTLAGGYSYDASCMDAKRYRPAGWEAAVAVGGGRVLVSGGAPNYISKPPCDDCDGGSGLFCATKQASLFTPPSTLAPVTEPLQVPRFGHAATLLADGNVLVTGGIGAGGGTPRLIGDAEIYNPRPLKSSFASDGMPPDPDDPLAADLKQLGLVRAPGQAATTPGGKTPARPCTQF